MSHLQLDDEVKVKWSLLTEIIHYYKSDQRMTWTFSPILNKTAVKKQGSLWALFLNEV